MTYVSCSSVGEPMTDQQTAGEVLKELHEARIAGQLDRMCGLFAADARFRIAGSSDGKPITMSANGIGEIRPWLSMLVKTFRLTEYTMLSTVVEGTNGVIHWRADIVSKVTGTAVQTEFVDLIELRAGRIGAYTEFFVPR